MELHAGCRASFVALLLSGPNPMTFHARRIVPISRKSGGALMSDLRARTGVLAVLRSINCHQDADDPQT